MQTYYPVYFEKGNISVMSRLSSMLLFQTPNTLATNLQSWMLGRACALTPAVRTVIKHGGCILQVISFCSLLTLFFVFVSPPLLFALFLSFPPEFCQVPRSSMTWQTNDVTVWRRESVKLYEFANRNFLVGPPGWKEKQTTSRENHSQAQNDGRWHNILTTLVDFC